MLNAPAQWWLLLCNVRNHKLTIHNGLELRHQHFAFLIFLLEDPSIFSFTHPYLGACHLTIVDSIIHGLVIHPPNREKIKGLVKEIIYEIWLRPKCWSFGWKTSHNDNNSKRNNIFLLRVCLVCIFIFCFSFVTFYFIEIETLILI